MKKIWPVLLLLCIESALSFEGVIHYEINDAGLPLKGKKYLSLGVSENKVRIDIVDNEKSKEVKSKSVIFDFPQKTCIVINEGKTQLIKFDNKYAESNFIEPEEALSKKNRKHILGYNVEEFESYYFQNKNRLRIETWYTPSLEMRGFKHIWHLNSVNFETSLYNFFFHPATGQIALELSFTRTDTSIKTFTASKVEKRKLDPEYFLY